MERKPGRKEFLIRSAAAGGLLLTPQWLLGQTANPPRGKFDDDSTAEEVTAGLDLKGKTILITGCNSGLGFESMRVLAMRGAHVLGAARTMEKAKAAAVKIKGRVTPVVCELSDLNSVNACAETVKGMKVPLDALICNAGILGLPERQTIRGIEKQFFINYLAHFHLTMGLMSALEAAPQGRIVMVSSRAYRWTYDEGVRLNDLSGEKLYTPRGAYGQSKLAQALFVREFQRRHPGSKVTANAIHPGVIWTNIGRHLPWYTRLGALLFGWTFMKDVPQGAATQCYVATNPKLAKVSGHFFNDCNPLEPTEAYWKNAELSRKLYNESLRLTADFRK